MANEDDVILLDTRTLQVLSELTSTGERRRLNSLASLCRSAELQD